MIRIAVVEDEVIYTRKLQEYIERYRQESGREIQTVFFTDGEDIVEDYKGNYDIILMDIQMRFMDGMTAAEKIRKLDGEVVIMFITNMIQYAIRGYAVDALDYVVKPVEYFAFCQKLEKAIGKIKKTDANFITISTREGVQKINSTDILYIEGQGHETLFRMKNRTVMTRETLKKMEKSMEQYGFFRCGKGYLVNMHHVDGVRGGDCVIGGEYVPVSRTKKKEFMEKLIQYMNES